MLNDYLGAHLNLTQLNGSASTYRLVFSDLSCGAVDLTGLTFALRVTSCADGTVYDGDAQPSAAESDVLTIFFPQSMIEGNYRWELAATSDAGETARVAYGQMLVLPSAVDFGAGSMGDDEDADEVRTLRVSLPDSASRRLRLQWRASSAASAAAQDAEAAAAAARAAADRAESAMASAGAAAEDALHKSEEALERANEVAATIGGALSDALRCDTETGTLWIGGVDTGCSYRGENGHSPWLSDSLTWVAWDDDLNGWRNTGISAVGEDGHSPYISSAGTWMVWVDDLEAAQASAVAVASGGVTASAVSAWGISPCVVASESDTMEQASLLTGTGNVATDHSSPLEGGDGGSSESCGVVTNFSKRTNNRKGGFIDTGIFAIGRDGKDGDAIVYHYASSYSDIPKTGETCNGGHYYLVPNPAKEWAWARMTFSSLPAVADGSDGAWMRINGETIRVDSSGELMASAEAIQAASKFVAAGIDNDGNLVLTSIKAGKVGNGIFVEWMNRESLTVSTPAGNANMNVYTIEFPAGFLGAGALKRVSMLVRTGSNSAINGEAYKLNVFERDENGEWQHVGASLNEEVQRAGEVITWEFSNNIANENKATLNGRAVRFELTDHPSGEGDGSKFYMCLKMSASTDGTVVYYDLDAQNPHAYTPQMEVEFYPNVEYGYLTGGVDEKPYTYYCYKWAGRGWYNCGETQGFATDELYGLVRLSTPLTSTDSYAVIGINGDGQIVVPKATLTDFGAVKIGSILSQLNSIPYQQAVGMLASGNLANNLLNKGAFKHMLLRNWKSRGMAWLTDAVAAYPSEFSNDNIFCTGIETSAQMTQEGGTLAINSATGSLLAGVYLATGMTDTRNNAVPSAATVKAHLAESYYSKTETNAKLAEKADKTGLYTQAEVDALLAEKEAALKTELKNWVLAQGFVTTKSLNDKLSGYVKTSETVNEIQALTTEEFNSLTSRENKTLYLN